MEIRHTHNPLTLKHDAVYTGVNLPPNQIIEQENLVFLRPVILLVNGQARMRKDWNLAIQDKDICHFVELPGFEGITLVGVLTTLFYSAIAYGAGLLLNMWFAPEASEPSEINQVTRHNLTSNRNIISLGQPFPEHFGRFICFPALIQRSYTEYIDNIQYQYTIGVIGIGKYEVEDVYIDKTPIADYDDVSYNIVEPGNYLTLCTKMVWTSSGIVQTDLTTTWLTSVINPAGTEISEIGFDILFPAGVYHINSHGKVRHWSVTIKAEVRRIDNDGGSLTSWVEIFNYQFDGPKTSPQRHTLILPVTDIPGRYELRIKRTLERSTATNIIDNAKIESLRGYGSAYSPYENLTLIELKIKATDQLNGIISNKINVVCTRKLKKLTSTELERDVSTTRSIVDAVAYIVTAENGGQQDEGILDFEGLAALRTILDGRSNYFDFIFSARTNVFDSCKKIAKCGRCIPIMPMGIFTLVRDKTQSVPTQIYTDDDYSEGSLTFSHFLKTDDSPDHIEVSYIDSDTWQAQTIICNDENGGTLIPAKIVLDGCVSRQTAWEEGFYAYWDDYYNRTAVSFVTGLKGFIPQIGDMIYVGSRQTDWAKTGQIAKLDGSNIWLSEPVDLGYESEGVLLLTSKIGGAQTAVTVIGTTDMHCVIGTINAGDIYTIDNDGDKATKFLFGKTTADILRVRILNIVSNSKNEIKINGSIIHDAVYSSPGVCPPLEGGGVIKPILGSLTIQYSSQSSGVFSYLLTWVSSESKFKVEIDEGSGYSTVVDNLEAYVYDYTSSALETTLKVTPYIAGVLTPIEALTESFSVPAAPVNLQITDNDSDLTVTWDAVTDATAYSVSFYYSAEIKYSETVDTTTLILSIAQLVKETGLNVFTTSIVVQAQKGVVIGAESISTDYDISLTIGDQGDLATQDRVDLDFEDGSTPTNTINVGVAITDANNKTTPVNADSIALIDSEDSDNLKELTMSNLKAFLKTYFDTLY